MNILIAHATVEGQTGKIAEHIARRVKGQGNDVTAIDVDNLDPVPFDTADAAILAASVHQRRHPKTFEAFLNGNRDALNNLPVLMLSVSLSAAFPEGREEAQDYLDEMKLRTGLAPRQEALIAGAIRIGKYDYFAMQVVRHVVLRGRDFDTSVGDHEFTDWDALDETIDGFLAGLT